LFVIDGQNDFLDPKGALCVQGADKEATLLANMLDRLAMPNGTHKITGIPCDTSVLASEHKIEDAAVREILMQSYAVGAKKKKPTASTTDSPAAGEGDRK